VSGYASWALRHVGEVERTWLTSLPPWQHFKNVCYHIRMADALGFHAAIFLTGHYGPNWQDLKLLIDIVQPHVGARLYGLPDFEANQPGFDGKTGDHAGKVETSLLWAVEPDCVDASRLPPRDQAGPHFAMGDTAYDADRRVGERMVADEAAWLGRKSAELLAAYARAAPSRRLRSFAEVEVLWHDVVTPRLGEFKTMQMWSDYPAPGEDSIWGVNWEIPRLT
jgi:creatinine amidohydrolase